MNDLVIASLIVLLAVVVIGYKIGFRAATVPYESEWIRVDSVDDAVVPHTVFVCEKCHTQQTHNTLHCDCCGSHMRYGKHFDDEEMLKLG